MSETTIHEILDELAAAATDNRDKGDKFDSDPWQLQAGQDSRDSTLHQFSRVDSSDVSGIVLLAQSTDDNVTTILLSISQVGGAKDAPQTTFSSDGSPSLPDGFPSDVPQYPGGTVVQSAFQKQSAGNTYLASFVTKDGADDALTYYRNAFQGSGWTVQDSDASQSSLKDAKAIQFTDGASKFSGDVTVGQFAEDTSYTRVDVQVQVAKASGG